MLCQFIYYKNEVIKNNQNEIVNCLMPEKGYNLIPHILKKTSEKVSDKIPNY